jgi:hypothetical protein
MEQLSATLPARSMYQSVVGLSMATLLQGMESLSRLLHGTSDEPEESRSVSQGGSSSSGSGASEISASATAANEPKGNQDIAREREDTTGLKATSATPPVILRLVEVYLQGQQSEVKPKASVWKSVLNDLRNHEKAYLGEGGTRPGNLALEALAYACIATDVVLTTKGFRSVCEKLKEHEQSGKQFLTEIGPGRLDQMKKFVKENPQAFCEILEKEWRLQQGRVG